MEKVYEELARELEEKVQNGGNDVRLLLGISGIPGSGKSTLAYSLCSLLNAKNPTMAVVVPMDGFHLTKKQLSEMPDPVEAFKRRGAPFTFDAEGLIALLHKIKKEGAAEAPAWSHTIGDPIPGGVKITPDNKVVIFEGIYLFYNESPWEQVSAAFDERWFIECPVEVAMQRVHKRHMEQMNLSSEEAQIRIDTNDQPNALSILEKLLPVTRKIISVPLSGA